MNSDGKKKYKRTQVPNNILSQLLGTYLLLEFIRISKMFQIFKGGMQKVLIMLFRHAFVTYSVGTSIYTIFLLIYCAFLLNSIKKILYLPHPYISEVYVKGGNLPLRSSRPANYGHCCEFQQFSQLSPPPTTEVLFLANILTTELFTQCR